MTNTLAPVTWSPAAEGLRAAARAAAAGTFAEAAALFEAVARSGVRYADLRTPDLPSRCVVMPFVGWFGLDTAQLAREFRARDVLLVPLDEQRPRRAPFRGLTTENWRVVAHHDVRLWSVARYEICLHEQRTVAELEAELPALLPVLAEWYGVAAEYLDRADVLTRCYEPETVVYAQGYLAASAALRRIALARGIRVLAIENTLHKDRLVWDDVSGVTVNLNLARNYWWRHEDSVDEYDAESFCARFFAGRAQLKQDEHSTPATARPPVGRAASGTKTLLFLAQVYTDSSVLFNTHAAWGSQLDVLRAAAMHARERSWRLVVKLHPKESAGPTAYGGVHHRVTQRRIEADPWFASVMGEPWLEVDADNRFDTLALIDGADACVTTTSQAGLEAAVRGKEVVLCGQAFYGGLGFTHDVQDDAALHSALDGILVHGRHRAGRALAQRFFKVFLESYCVPRTAGSIAALACGGNARRCDRAAGAADEDAGGSAGERKDFSYGSGERQTALHVDGIRADHRARYELAAAALREFAGSGVELTGCDVFCGNGYGSQLVSHVTGANVVGIDGSAEAITVARSRFVMPRTQYEHAVFPFVLPEGHFDFALCFESLEHVGDGAGLLEMLARALKPNGVLFLSTPNEAALPHAGNSGYFRHHTRHYLADEVVALASSSGLHAVCAFGQDVYHSQDGRVTGLRPEHEMRPVPLSGASQFMVHVFQKAPAPHSPAPRRSDA